MITTIYCEWCDDEVNYDILDAGVEYFCSLNCAQSYTNHYEFTEEYNESDNLITPW